MSILTLEKKRGKEGKFPIKEKAKRKEMKIPNQRVGESKKKRKEIPNQRMGESKKRRRNLE